MLLASASALRVPGSTPRKSQVHRPPDVSPVADEVARWLEEERSLIAPTPPTSLPQSPLNQDSYGQELLALFVSTCIVIGFSPAASAMPAPGVAAEGVEGLLFSPQVSPATFALMSAGAAITYVLSREVAAWAMFFFDEFAKVPGMKAGNAIGKPSDPIVATVPLTYQDWLAGRPMPSLEEVTDACVLIASGPHGSWSMCSEPKDDDCEPDTVYTAYYGHPIYICRV
jgi:hypothetical protein